MKKIYLLVVCTAIYFSGFSQQLLSWSPEFPTDASNLVVTVDCNKGNRGLYNFEGGNSANVYVHVGVITSANPGAGNWAYVPFTWGSSTAAAKATALGNNKYQFTISNIRSFFNVPAAETILKVAFIFRNATGSLKQVNSDGSDMYIPVYAAGQYAVRLNLPPTEPRYIPWAEPITVAIGQSVNVAGVASQSSGLSVTHNGNTIGTAAAAQNITATATISAACQQKIILTGSNGISTAKDSVEFFVAQPTVVEALPAGTQDGINYNSSNSVTLVLYAPGKNNVTVIGDFTNWQRSCAYQMKKTPDGNRFHITLNGLTASTIYRFQYVVDGSITVADPYSELILDPWNDQYIPAANYPGMPAYPSAFTSGIVSTFQTAAPAYTWSGRPYARPEKKSLIVYELLIRDFLANQTWQTLADTLSYLQRLGINAIEIMPFNEFEGNLSWGYNVDYFFAPDKMYGPKNALKRFVDSAHSKGMAVIMDAVLNHATGLNPYAQMWWNGAASQPAANSPFFNQTATHPFSVFNDFNHESEATKYHVSRFIRHWLTEYKIDGFRWDLSKGFTQRVSSDVASWNAYDASRVAIWQRYYDSIQAVSNNAYCILEHLGNDDEEADLSNRGMMLWGKMTDSYNQNTMGFANNSDINRAFARNRPGWNQLHLVTYAESHDEERIMYKNLTFGNNSNAAHNVRNLNTALARTEAMMPFLLLIPGPKMLWEFQELGYDKSIFMCENGTVPTPYGNDQCKLAPKPALWNYYSVPERRKIFDVVSGINRLRAFKPNTFLSTTIGGNLGNSLQKSLTISHPDMSVVAIANFDLTAQNVTVTFPSSGTWYNFFSTATYNATGAAETINLQPGEYRVYTNISYCLTAAPVVNSPVTYCQNATATALTASGSNLLWYTSASGGTGSSTAPIPSTTSAGSTTYYVSQTNGCEGPRSAIVVTISATPAAPAATSNVNYCQNSTATPLTATGNNLQWYTVATGGTGSATAPTPSTATIGTTVYYVSQSTGSCESPRTAITVNITATTAAPTVNSPLSYCQGATAQPLTANGTSLLWYTTSTGGTGSATAPTPNTTTVGSTTYYVSQTQSCGESPRTAIVVNVVATPSAPAVNSPVTYCQNAAASALTATGVNLLWYSTATGGTGSATAPVPSTTSAGSVNYYVSQNPSGCEGPRSTIVVTVNAAPPAPAVTASVNLCQGASASPLTATGSNLLWYNAATGGTGSASAPIPSTSAAGTTNYYVSQTVGGCESQRASIAVTVNATPAAPTVTSPIVYCQNETANALSATGTNLLWFTSATGGIGSSTAPIPSTTAAGSTNYYVASSNSCGEGARATITVNVTATPAAPTNLLVSNITQTGATLNWTGQAGSYFTVEYKESAAPVWTVAANGITNTSITLSNLQLGKNYQWRVSANCAAANSGNYAEGSFATISRNSIPTNIKNGIGVQIAPNPLSSNAIIDYSTIERGHVAVSVIDAEGRLVKKLFDGILLAGRYTISTNLKFLSAGNYLLRVQLDKKANSIVFVKMQ